MMRFVICLFLFFFVLAPKAFAHIAGQPPFFLMNGRYSDFYPVYTTSLSGFELPQDIAPELYLINQPIEMKIEKTLLPFPPEVIETIQFSWDFGDGMTVEGTENTHTYTKPGSYLLKVNADYGDYSGADTQPVIQAVLLHVLPNKDYKLPQAKITINNKTIADPLVDTVSFPLKEELILDATSSLEGTSPITEYFWDLGNGDRSTEAIVPYLPDTEQAYLFPFLRIKDANGFISDTYVQIETVNEKQANTFPSMFSKLGLPLLIGGNVILIGGALWYILRKKSA